MSERIPAFLVPTARSRRKYKAAVFNCAAANKDMPMRFAGLFCEGRRDCQHRCGAFGERAGKRREGQVIANSQPKAAPGKVGQYGQLARTIVARLAVALTARQVAGE